MGTFINSKQIVLHKINKSKHYGVHHETQGVIYEYKKLIFITEFICKLIPTNVIVLTMNIFKRKHNILLLASFLVEKKKQLGR